MMLVFICRMYNVGHVAIKIGYDRSKDWKCVTVL